MKSTLLYRDRVNVTVKSGRRIAVVMDLFKVPENVKGFPDGYRFSWIAFDAKNPEERVLFDVHPPKGPHLHIDGDKAGVPYEWKNLRQAEEFFISKIEERFGEIIEETEE